MPIVRWEPFRDFPGMQRQLNRIFAFPRAFGGPLLTEEESGVSTWMPAVDIFETDQNIVLKVELAGVDPKDVEVRVENNTLYLKGQRKAEKEVTEEKYHHVERTFGSFARSFALPNSVDGEKVTAEYQDGVLTLTLPKKEEAKPKAVKITINRG